MEGHTTVVRNELEVVISQQGGRTRSAASIYKQTKRQERQLEQARGQKVNTPSLCTSLIMYVPVHKNSHDCKES